MPLSTLLQHKALVRLFLGLTSGTGLVPLQHQLLVLPWLPFSTMQHLARGLQPDRQFRFNQGRFILAQRRSSAAACQAQRTKHSAVGHHASTAAVPQQDTCAARQTLAQPAAIPYRRWRSSTTSRSPQQPDLAAGSNTAAYHSLADAQHGLQQLQQQQEQQANSAVAAASAPAAASRTRGTSTSLAPTMRQRRVSSSLAAAVAAAAAAASAANAMASQVAVSTTRPGPYGMGVVAAAATKSNSGHSRSTSSSIEPIRRRRSSSSLAASMAAAKTDAPGDRMSTRLARSSSSSRTASSVAVDPATAPASMQLPTQQQQQGLRGPRRISTSSLWPVQQQRILQQQQQQQHELQRLQQLCRYPDQHWQQVHQQQSDHNLHYAQEQHYELDVQQQQQQWPAELLQPPAAQEPVLLDISALWRENQRELLTGQQQPQPQQQHLLLQHQHPVWVAVHQLKGPGSPAAVWVQAAQLELTAEQLQLSGQGEQQQAVVRLQRPDMGQAPAAVVEGLTFQHSSSLLALQEASQAVAGAAAANEGDANAASDSGEAAAAVAAAVAPACKLGMAPDGSSSDSVTSSSSSSSRYDYLLLCSGEFSVVEHCNMFPNSLSHCGDGRTLHNARGAADVASFVAEPREPELRQHMINLIRQAWDRRNYEEGSAITRSSSSSGVGGSSGRSRGSRGLDPCWVMAKVLQRWGAGAMVKFGVDDGYFSARFLESGLVTLPPPTVSGAVPDVSVYSSAGGQQQ